MKKKCAVIVPHQDDEINLAGGLIYDLTRNNWDVYIIYTTNGDLNRKREKGFRLKEALCAGKKLGLEEEKIIFLGYGDGCVELPHIYNSADEQVIVSPRGYDKTYGLENHGEFCYEMNRCHHSYTRKNMKQDLKNAVMRLMADVLICVDFDSHCDHRATSLLFEEIMGEILLETQNYKPLVLKGFAYAGKWDGQKDYYNIPMLRTLAPSKAQVLDERYELDNPIYNWDERISIEHSKQLCTELLINNPLFWAMTKHVSQPAWYFSRRVINRDSVFWKRRTDSLLCKADISVTSGEKSYLTDFKFFDCSNICDESKGIEIFDCGAWVPDKNDNEPKIKIKFHHTVDVNQISIYEKINHDSFIQHMDIIFDNGYKLQGINLRHDGKETRIVFEMQYNIRLIEIVLCKTVGENVGITEIEVFDNSNEVLVSEILPLSILDEDSNEKEKRITISQRLERILFDICYLFRDKWKKHW